MKYQIKQLGVGGILDQSIKIVRDHAALLFTIVALTVVPLQTIMGFLQTKMQEAIIDHDQSTVLTFALLVIVAGLMAIPVSILVNAAVIHAVASAYLSRETTLGSCFRHALTRFWPLLGTTILVGLAVMGGMILCLIPGIIFAFWFGLAQHVTVLEGIAGTAAMTRSRALMKGNVLMALALGLILVAVSIPIVFGAQMIPEKHLSVFAASLAQGITTVFGTAAMVVFYFSCRCKLENFDLQMLADAVGAEQPALAVDGVDVIEP